MSENKHAKRAEAVWDRAMERPPKQRTPHEVAVAYAASRWGGCGSMAAWEDKWCRYHGAFHLPLS